MKTRAALFHAVGTPLEVVEIDLAEPRPHEVVVRMAAVGICGTDLHQVKGEFRRPTPMVLGHEGAGVIEEIGDAVTRVRPGDDVVLSWAPSCGECAGCRRGRPATCARLNAAIPNGTLPDGSTGMTYRGETVYRGTATGCLAERVVVHEQVALPLAGAVPFDQAALLGCAVLTGVGVVLYAAGVERGASVLVMGAVGVVVVAALAMGAAAGGAGAAGGVVAAVGDATAGGFGVATGAVADVMADVTGESGPVGLGAAARARLGTAATITSSDVAATSNRSCLRRSPTSVGYFPKNGKTYPNLAGVSRHPNSVQLGVQASSAVGRRRSRLRAPCRRFDSRRWRTDPMVGRVTCRRRGGTSASRRRSRRRSRASSRLRVWLRASCAIAVTRGPRRAITRRFSAALSALDASTSKMTSTREAVTFAC